MNDKKGKRIKKIKEWRGGGRKGLLDGICDECKSYIEKIKDFLLHKLLLGLVKVSS
jgi:hypothetical protein